MMESESCVAMKVDGWALGRVNVGDLEPRDGADSI